MAYFGKLEGAHVSAHDGTFLGAITERWVHPEAITNPIGVHGNQTSGSSIFNPYGLYGNEVSPQSAFNEIAPDPPQVYQRGNFIAYLSVNPQRAPRIDPRELFGGGRNPGDL